MDEQKSEGFPTFDWLQQGCTVSWTNFSQLLSKQTHTFLLGYLDILELYAFFCLATIAALLYIP